MAGFFDSLFPSIKQGLLGYNYANPGSAVTGGVNKLNTGTGTNWFGQFGVLPTVGLGLQALTGLGDLWMGMRNYQLAQNAFNFQKALANRNLQNQGKIINNAYDTAGNVGAGLIGGVDANGNYGAVDDRVLAAQQEQARKQHVDTSYIG